MNERGEDADAAAGRAPGLVWLRWQLERLVGQRLLALLSAMDQHRYRELLGREHELLDRAPAQIAG